MFAAFPTLVPGLLAVSVEVEVKVYVKRPLVLEPISFRVNVATSTVPLSFFVRLSDGVPLMS